MKIGRIRREVVIGARESEKRKRANVKGQISSAEQRK